MKLADKEWHGAQNGKKGPYALKNWKQGKPSSAFSVHEYTLIAQSKVPFLKPESFIFLISPQKYRLGILIISCTSYLLEVALFNENTKRFYGELE